AARDLDRPLWALVRRPRRVDRPGQQVREAQQAAAGDVEQARELGARKLSGLMRERPDLILSANPGCRMQLDGAQDGHEVPRPVLHPAQLLWQALRPSPPAARR
ncbi:MAG: hypothetical protein ACPGQD_09570, partial [Planctomycetota bacterium]